MSRSARIRIAAGGLVAAAIVLMAVGSAVGKDNAGQGMSLDLYLRNTSFVGGPPAAPGDRNQIGFELYRLGGTEQAPEPAGDPIGHAAGECVMLTVDGGLCVAIYHLDGRGTIATQFEYLFATGIPGVAVTGGTDEFAGASGAGTEVVSAGHPSDRIVRFELTGYNQP